MSIASDSVVTIYSDTMAYILVFGLLAMASRFRVGRDNRSDQLFYWLCVLTIINAVSNGISYGLHHQDTGWAAPVRMIFPTIAEYSTLLVLFAWFVYVDYKLYSSWDHTMWVCKIYQVPIYVIGVFCIINMFTGFMFDVTYEHLFVAKPLFYVFSFLQYAYGILPVIAIIRYVKTHGKLHFFHIQPVVVPVLVGSLFTLFTDYSARSFGFAIALVFLHMSYINLWRFEDRDSGFYNRHYVVHLMHMCREEKLDYHSAIEFNTASTPKEFYDILRVEIPGKAEIIRMDQNRFLLFSESPKASMITLLSSMIQDAADEYDETHKGETPIDLLISYRIRKKNESAENFIKSMVEA